jgi:protein-L-isoaspartate(D-aspartate) O-methyltransferase
MQIDRQTELAIIRRAYAKQTLAAARVRDPRIQAAYAAVPREDYLGPGPWQVMRMMGGYAPTPDADPVYLYVDQVIGIVPERWLNNGQPSFHAGLLSAAGINEGEHVVHVGCGTGYYSAIMAHLAGASGKVTAIEFDPELAMRARQSLAVFPNVTVIEGDGTTVPFDGADVVYVNAGVTRPMPTWLDGLKDGGRLLFPLTTDYNFRNAKPGVVDPIRLMKSGAYFRVQRRGTRFEARGIMATAIIPCENARDPQSEVALAAAFEKVSWTRVDSLVRGEEVPEDRCWLRGEGWCLTYE